MPLHVPHIALFLLSALAPASPAFAGPFQSDQDTARVYRYGEVVVSAERYPVSAEKAGAVSYDIVRDASWEFGGPGSALSGARNLHLASYGGGMSLQTVSMRGMGAEHTLFLWNGLPAGNMQTGISDVNLFSAADIGEIQVVPGGASAIHGTAAIGGVVNMAPSSPLDAPPSVALGATAGSFGEAGMFVRGTFRPDSAAGVSARASSVRGKGDYPFVDPATGVGAVRTGSDYSSRAMNLSAGLDRGPAGRVGLVVSALSLDQGSPGPWHPSAPPPDARRNDERLIAAVSYDRPGGAVPPLRAAAMVDMQYERYVEPTGITAADNYYRTTWAGGSGQFRRAAGDSWIFQAGTDFRYERAAGNAIDGTKERVGAAFSASASWTVTDGGGPEATVTPSVRADAASTFTPRYSPRLGVNVEWKSGVVAARLHGSAAGASRNPTMNELWYAGEGGTGNPALRTESAVSVDFGAGGTIRFLGLIAADVTWYRIGMTDRIQWTPTLNPRFWSPVNIGQSRSTGWEFSGRWTFAPGELEVDFDYALIDSKRGDVSVDGTMNYAKQLAYVPLDKGSIGLLIGKSAVTGWLAGLAGTVRIVYTGERYTLEDNSASLPGNAVAEAGVTARFSITGGTATIRYSAGNLSGLEYEVMPGYPMPGFHHGVSIIWNFKV